MLTTILIVLLVLIIFLVAFLMVRTSAFLRAPELVEPAELPEVDAERVARHLAEAVQVETVSSLEAAAVNRAAFRDLRSLLEKLYPRVHAVLEREIISEHSLLFRWKGSNPELRPVLFAAHLDVVPADPGTLDQWEYPPFSGAIADGYVWGRGSIDIKSQVISLLEAVEELIKAGFQPERSLYLAFGQDEEIGGHKGAQKIVEFLQGREETLEVVLDEGGAIIAGMLPGIDSPVAMIGTAEKGYLSLKLSVQSAPGHSSAPPEQTAIGILARALARLEARPLPARLAPIRETYRALGSAVSPWLQLVFANLWLFGGTLRKQMAAVPQTNAAIRTTTAITIIQGGLKDNILPARADAVVNFRLMPGDTIASVCDYVRKVVDDERVTMEAVPDSAWEASPVTPADSDGFVDLSRAVREVFPEAETAPYLVMGATDARYYTAVSEQVLRFTPLLLEREELNRMHGINERVPVEGLGRMVQFYLHLMRSWCSDGKTEPEVEPLEIETGVEEIPQPEEAE